MASIKQQQCVAAAWRVASSGIKPSAAQHAWRSGIKHRQQAAWRSSNKQYVTTSLPFRLVDAHLCITCKRLIRFFCGNT